MRLYNSPQVDPDYQQLLEQQFNILSVFETKEFDCGKINRLISKLEQSKKEVYNPDDRYIVVHFDTDFYWHGHGINLNNLFSVWTQLDIPLYTLIYYTNHYGIKKEIDQLCQGRDAFDQPTVIETMINPGNYRPQGYNEFDTDITKITHHALCLMAGTMRSHRGALYNHLKHLSPEQIAMTIKGKKCT